MKALTLVVFLFFQSIQGWGQNNDADTGWFAIRKSAMFGNKLEPPLWVLDGQLLNDTVAGERLKQINPDSVLEISILRDSIANETVGAKAVVLITTRPYARKQIEALLTNRAKGYQEYQLEHKGNMDFVYVVDGYPVEGKPDEVLKKLYDLPLSRISFVGLLDKYKFTASFQRSAIVITTKKENN